MNHRKRCARCMKARLSTSYRKDARHSDGSSSVCKGCEARDEKQIAARRLYYRNRQLGKMFRDCEST